MAISFKEVPHLPAVILMGGRWYVAYPLSTRRVEELILERGVEVDDSTQPHNPEKKLTTSVDRCSIANHSWHSPAQAVVGHGARRSLARTNLRAIYIGSAVGHCRISAGVAALFLWLSVTRGGGETFSAARNSTENSTGWRLSFPGPPSPAHTTTRSPHGFYERTKNV
jgi:hypothetical protein